MIRKAKNWALRRIVRRVAHHQGLLDPFMVLDNLRRFARRSEVAEPGELLRAGVVFHARGLMNRAMQYNDDWVWPYWAERQLDPTDPAFVPRGFTITHINLAHRNWTGIGLPDHHEIPIVDPRGLLTPLYDGWSIDGWVLDPEGRLLAPSREKEARQELTVEPNLAVTTETARDGMSLTTQASCEVTGGRPVCSARYAATSERGGWLVLGLRPTNPEGIHFLYDIEMEASLKKWIVDKTDRVFFNQPADRQAVSNYRHGDVALFLDDDRYARSSTHCEIGMATAAALFKLEPGRERRVAAAIPIDSDEDRRAAAPLTLSGPQLWKDACEQCTRLELPDPEIAFITRAAIRTLILHAPDENCYPGPFTYKRFWFRDAALILQAMTCAGLTTRARRVLDSFPDRQTLTGHYLSQEGEWDSNGQALWTMRRYCERTGTPTPEAWKKSIARAAQWIHSKRRAASARERPGLFPAGFSAEHLGLNDFYYWDDFWGVAGLQAAADMLDDADHADKSAAWRREADEFFRCIEDYLRHDAERRGHQAMPAAPERRFDAGAIGNMPPGYPLQQMPARDPRLLETVEKLMHRYFTNDAFLHHIGHSGYNAYLTLHAAQVLMRADDPRAWDCIRAVARLASPTGQWPEAVHPLTFGGCMGDGQHVWAAAEWFMTLRNMFAREENERLVLCQGIPAEWLEQEQEIHFGPTPTDFGPVTVRLQPGKGRTRVSWEADWRRPPARIELRLPGSSPRELAPDANTVEIDF